MRDTAALPVAEAGFTLVELMVAIVIIGMMAAAVVVALPDRQGSVAHDGTALAARLVMARDLSITGGRDVAVKVDAAGYGFAVREAGGWRAPREKALAARPWAPGVTVEATIDDGTVIFDTTGLATPGQVILRQDGATSRISIDSGGAVRVDAG
jgi:general secretion pathway protein H